MIYLNFYAAFNDFRKYITSIWQVGRNEWALHVVNLVDMRRKWNQLLQSRLKTKCGKPMLRLIGMRPYAMLRGPAQQKLNSSFVAGQIKNTKQYCIHQ
jgi:hypothetical protein